MEPQDRVLCLAYQEAQGVPKDGGTTFKSGIPQPGPRGNGGEATPGTPGTPGTPRTPGNPGALGSSGRGGGENQGGGEGKVK